MSFSRLSFLCCLLSLNSSFVLLGAEPSVQKEHLGKLPNGEDVHQFTLRNRNGLQAKVIEYGATLTELLVPDRKGQMANVVLGSNSLEAYLKGFPAASVIGRYANRIQGAKFSLEGREYNITKNSGENHIHGGRNNFAKLKWVGLQPVKQVNGLGERIGDSAQVIMNYKSQDGEEGFPGNLDVTVVYSLSDRNELSIVYQATTDRPTVVNLTNHAYFNLAGPGTDVLRQELQLMSDTYTVVDKSLIPTGEIASVTGTPLDFRESHRIGERIEKLYDSTRGYDHNYIVRGEFGSLRMAAKVIDRDSGRVMECLTTEPGVQLYTANGFNGIPYPRHGGFCLETQHYPDSPNRPEFPTTIVRPGDRWNSETVYRFSILD